PAYPMLKSFPQIAGSWDWIRRENGPEHRQIRVEEAKQLITALQTGGFLAMTGNKLQTFRFNRIKEMLQHTQRLSIAKRLPRLPSNPRRTCRCDFAQGTAVAVAVASARQGKKVAVVNAASAYHAGGGFSSGGRHAMEDQALFPDLGVPVAEKRQRGHAKCMCRRMAASSAPELLGRGPALSFSAVEVLRQGSAEGYQLLGCVLELAAVISVAMFNRNPRVRDSPVDAPEDPAAYASGVRKKFLAVFHAAALCGAEVIVLPDVGCSVFQNDPAAVGRIAGQALQESTRAISPRSSSLARTAFSRLLRNPISVDLCIAGANDNAEPIAPAVALDLDTSLPAAEGEAFGAVGSSPGYGGAQWLREHNAAWVDRCQSLSLQPMLDVLLRTDAAFQALLSTAPPGLMPTNVDDCLKETRTHIQELSNHLQEQMASIAELQEESAALGRTVHSLQAAQQSHRAELRQKVAEAMRRTVATFEKPLDDMRSGLRQQSQALAKSRTQVSQLLDDLAATAHRAAVAQAPAKEAHAAVGPEWQDFIMSEIRQVRSMGKTLVANLEEGCKAVEKRMQQVMEALANAWAESLIPGDLRRGQAEVRPSEDASVTTERSVFFFGLPEIRPETGAMTLLRRATQVGARGARSASTAVVASSQESFAQKTWRWLDVTGYYTKWHSRRAWILDLDPPQRSAAVLVTEYERKLLLWLTWMNFFFLPISVWYWYGQFTHLSSKPPIPLMPEYQYLNGRKRDFSHVGGRWHDCKECRWLEFECKKICFDRLRDEGREIWGLRRPRTQTIGFH
ncbi:unnamed protein product, partial [Effrenium voratum]